MAIEYPPGTPCWVDLATTDPDAAIGFYGALFGWEAGDPAPPEMGSYRILSLNGEPVAGLGTVMNEGQPPAWTTYIATADADAAAEAVGQAGGQTLLPPMDVMEEGRLALFSDAAGGAVFGVWQPGNHRGSQVVNQVGGLAWDELDTRDVQGAETFYGSVFGWTTDPIEYEGEVVYLVWKLDGRTIGGILPMGDNFPPEVPPNWVVYFGTESIDATTAQVEQLGGRVLMGKRPMPQGAFAVFADPQGAVFAGWEGSYDPPPG